MIIGPLMPAHGPLRCAECDDSLGPACWVITLGEHHRNIAFCSECMAALNDTLDDIFEEWLVQVAEERMDRLRRGETQTIPFDELAHAHSNATQRGGW